MLLSLLPRACCRLLLVAAGLLWWQTGWAQDVQRLQTQFERDVNRYRWEAVATVAQQAGRWQLDARNLFSSDAFLLFRDQLSFRDENLLHWTATRPLGRVLSARLRGHNGWYSQSRVFSQEVYAGVRYEPLPYAWVEPAFGMAWDRRPGVAPDRTLPPLRTDLGPAYGVRFAAAPPPQNGYVFSLEGEGAWQVITPRRGRALRLATSAEGTFEEARLGARFGVASVRRDAYEAVSFLNRDTGVDRLSETVEATTSDTLLAVLTLDTPFYLGTRLTSRLDLSSNNRFVRTYRAPTEALYFDTDFSRRAADAEVALHYERPRLSTRLAVRTGAEVERRQLANREDLPPTQAAQKANLLQQADSDRGLFSLHARARANPTARAVLSFDGSASILRHDTPEANPDDRDEVLHSAQLGLLYRFSRYVEADVRVFGTYFHTVYIDATRSAENNRQRSLRLRPGVQWSPSERTKVRLSTEVRATYTVDDFLLPGRRPKDQSARELRYDLEAEHDVGGGLRLLGEGSVSNLHLGRLLWDQFAEIPFDTLRTYSAWLRVQAGRTIVADVGVRIFVRTDFDRATSVRYPRRDAAGALLRDDAGQAVTATISRPGRTWIEQIGPTCAISWPMGNGSTLRLDGWLNVQHVRRRLYGGLPEATAADIRRAGQDGTRQVIPNVALTVLWNL